ncbi:hypothetical protein, partial [Paenibacillus forsythiae]|uniref:hypothetical protein n=1 Tax=Paenibacillus forsythiae TaxID=365616 RepID=UPI001E54A274
MQLFLPKMLVHKEIPAAIQAFETVPIQVEDEREKTCIIVGLEYNRRSHAAKRCTISGFGERRPNSLGQEHQELLYLRLSPLNPESCPT